jgi:hypothetical protein
MNRFQGTNSARLCSLAGRYDNPIPSRYLAPINCLKIPALQSQTVHKSGAEGGGGGGEEKVLELKGEKVNYLI